MLEQENFEVAYAQALLIAGEQPHHIPYSVNLPFASVVTIKGLLEGNSSALYEINSQQEHEEQYGDDMISVLQGKFAKAFSARLVHPCPEPVVSLSESEVVLLGRALLDDAKLAAVTYGAARERRIEMNRGAYLSLQTGLLQAGGQDRDNELALLKATFHWF